MIGRFLFGRRRRWRGGGGTAAQLPPHRPCNGRTGQENRLRHRRDDADRAQDQRHRQPPARIGKLSANLPGQVALIGHAGNNRRRRNRQQQRRHLRHQRITDRERDVSLPRLGRGQAVADHPDGEPGDDIDRQDQQSRRRIALHEFGRTIHRTVEIGLNRNFAAAFARFVSADEACGNIGVNRHLLARQGVQHKAGGHFGHAACAFGDDDHVDDHQDRKHEQADHKIAADQKGGKAFDHLARRSPAFVAVDQHDAGRGDVQGEPQQGREQQHAGKAGEIERAAGIQGHHQHRNRNRDVEHEEDIQQQHRNRQDHQRQQRKDANRQGHFGRHGEQPGHRAVCGADGRVRRIAHRPNAFNRS